MKKIEVSELTENFFETISKEWMLVCAGDANRYNMMTASWGGIGWLWNKPVAFVFGPNAILLNLRKTTTS